MNSLPLSSASRAVLAKATEDSTRFGHHFLGVDHVFVAVTDAAPGLDTELSRRGVGLDELRARIIEGIEPLQHRPWGTELLVTPRCSEILDLAGRIARRNRKPQVTPTHLLEAILREGGSVPVRLLRSRDVRIADLCEAVALEDPEPTEHKLPLLERFGRDLTALAREGALMPVFARDVEMRMLAEVLLRKRKNNPVLIGDPGVGKTAVVEGLASMLATVESGHPLRNVRIIELSVATLLAGTKYRGDFEERVVGILKEATSDPHVILFFDEIHTLVGAGASAGDALGASDIVKPAMARGELRCIGATTIAEYRRHIERDAALERRFEPVLVDEPAPEQARMIVAGLAPALALHHGVEIADSALEAAVELTIRYLPHRRLPDKAIDAIDQSAARLRLEGPKSPTDRLVVNDQAIACTVSQWTGIPLEQLSGAAAERLLSLESKLRDRVVGQDAACEAVARTILTGRSGLADPNRPMGTFLFLGPTGVGKTELAKALAHCVFGDEKRLVRFDMSEYMEPHSVSKLIGAPPGYVGHEGEGLLVSALRTHPDSVVLFDEIEKAHAQVFDLFLQVFDEGRLTDAHGKRADFRHAVIILTSNIVFRLPAPPATPLGFRAEPAAPAPVRFDVRDALATVLRPELVNRIDEILVFQPLDRAALRRIIDRYLKSIEQLVPQGLDIELSDGVYDLLIERGVSSQFGARELRRAIDRHLRHPIAEELLRRGPAAGTVRVVRDQDRIRFEFAPSDPRPVA